MADQQQQQQGQQQKPEHAGYVTVHTLVDDWPAGSVITRAQAEEAKAHVARQTLDDERIAAQREQSRFSRVLDNAPRLLSLGAIRPATDAEVQAGKAEAPREGAQMARSLDQAEQELAAARAENERLKAEAGKSAGVLEGQPVPSSDTSDEVRRLREESERLRAENEALKAQQQQPTTPPPEEVPTAQPVEEEEEMGFRKRRK